MDLNKHLEFFNPLKVDNEVHIIGVGALGGYIAQQLVKLGIEEIHIWDYDTVEEHNLTNQLYNQNDISKSKTDALEQHLLAINPKVIVKKHNKWTNQLLKGYIFSTVDSIETRKKIVEENLYSVAIELVIDGRIGLNTGQVITTDWIDEKDKLNYLKLCDFKDSEVEMKRSACGTTLSVSPTVLVTVAYAVAQFINFLNGEKTPQLIQFDAFTFKTVAN